MSISPMNQYSNHFQNPQSFQIESNHHMRMTRNNYPAIYVSLSEIIFDSFVFRRSPVQMPGAKNSPKRNEWKTSLKVLISNPWDHMKLFFFECFLLQTLEPKVYIRPLFIQNPLPSSNLRSHESLDDKGHITNTLTWKWLKLLRKSWDTLELTLKPMNCKLNLTVFTLTSLIFLTQR